MTGSPRVLALLAVAMVLGPVLMFPEVIPAAVRTPVAGGAALLAFAGAVLFLRSPLLTLFTVGVIVTVIVGWQRAVPSSSSLAHFTGVSAGVLLMSVVGAWCRTHARLLLLLCAVLVVGTLTIVVGLLGTRSPGPKLITPDVVARPDPILRLGIPGLASDGYVNPNALGVTALLILPLGCVAVLLGRRSAAGSVLPVLGLVATLVSGVIIFVSQSRATWIAACLLLVVVACRCGARWRRRLAGLAAVAVFITAGVLIVQQRNEAAFRKAVTVARASMSNRLEILEHGVAALRQAPWLGIGLNEFRHREEGKIKGWPVAHAHNIFLQTALDIGLIGLAFYVALIALLLVWADRLVRDASPLLAHTAAGAGLSILGAHVFGLADALPLGAKVGAFQWLAAGLIVAAHGVSHAAQRPPDGGTAGPEPRRGRAVAVLRSPLL